MNLGGGGGSVYKQGRLPNPGLTPALDQQSGDPGTGPAFSWTLRLSPKGGSQGSLVIGRAPSPRLPETRLNTKAQT